MKNAQGPDSSDLRMCNSWSGIWKWE